MSGGSHGHVDRDMEYGILVPQEGNLRALAGTLRGYLDVPTESIEFESDAHIEVWRDFQGARRAGRVSEYGVIRDASGGVVPGTRPVTEAERAEVAAHGVSALAELDRLAVAVDELKARARELAGVAHALDYADSGDTSASGVWRALLEWGRARASRASASENHGLDTDDRVRFYEHDFYPLSNFSAFALGWKGHVFGTSEAAYHWEKFPGENESWSWIRQEILYAKSAHAAFKIAESMRARRRPDWDDVKVDVMREILRAKVAQHEYVRRKLLATGERELVEDSWRDDFWGWGPRRDGRNQLGRLWMEIRSEIRLAERAAIVSEVTRDRVSAASTSAK